MLAVQALEPVASTRKPLRRSTATSGFDSFPHSGSQSVVYLDVCSLSAIESRKVQKSVGTSDIEAVQRLPLALVTGEKVHDDTKYGGSDLELAQHLDIGDS